MATADTYTFWLFLLMTFLLRECSSSQRLTVDSGRNMGEAVCPGRGGRHHGRTPDLS